MGKAWWWYSIGAILTWGLWGFLGALGGRTVGVRHLLLLSYAGIAIVFLLVLVIGNPGSAPWRTTDGWYSILSGLVCGVGFLFFYLALESGEASKVVVLTSLYPAITVALAVFVLREPWTLKYTLGMLSALAGFILLST